MRDEEAICRAQYSGDDAFLAELFTAGGNSALAESLIKSTVPLVSKFSSLIETVGPLQGTAYFLRRDGFCLELSSVARKPSSSELMVDWQ